MRERIVSRFSELLAIKARREGRKISKRQVGIETNLPKKTIDRYANNHVTRFDESSVLALCKYLDCNVGDLLVIEEIESPEMGSPLIAAIA
jgi:DNA-binding Xre family transcriptional regulator